MDFSGTMTLLNGGFNLFSDLFPILGAILVLSFILAMIGR